MTRTAVVLGLCLIAGPAGAGPRDGSARAFVESLYQSYSQRDVAPVLGKRASIIFAAKLLAEIRADQTRHEGETDKLDHDPICDCQDSDGLNHFEMTLTGLSDEQSEASVHFKLGDSDKSVRLRLVDTQAGWRVADIATPATPSLEAFLVGP